MVGCSSERPAAARGGDAVAMVNNKSGEGMESEVRGTVAVTDSGCVALEVEGGQIMPAIWPKGTKFDGQTLTFPGGTAARIGDAISGVGGEVPNAQSDFPDIPQECLDQAGGTMAVLNEASKV